MGYVLLEEGVVHGYWVGIVAASNALGANKIEFDTSRKTSSQP